MGASPARPVSGGRAGGGRHDGEVSRLARGADRRLTGLARAASLPRLPSDVPPAGHVSPVVLPPQQVQRQEGRADVAVGDVGDGSQR